MMLLRCGALCSLRRTTKTLPFIGQSRFCSSSPEILVERDVEQKSIAIVKLNKPKKLNAMSVSLGEAFQKEIHLLKSDPSLRAVVITGNGKAFSAGGDLDFLRDRVASPPTKNVEEMLNFYNRFLSLTSLPVPVLTAINGAAVGAGLCLALATDIRVVAKDAKLSLNFVRIGLHPGLASTHFLPLIVGYQNAARLLMTGETITGEEAEKIGLVIKAVEADQVLSYTLNIARQISTASPVAVRGLTHTLRSRRDSNLIESITKEATAQAVSYASPDMEIGLNSIKDRSEPKF